MFCGLSVEPLSHVPFQSPHLGEQRFTPRDLAWDLPPICSIRFARCIGGFVGSDILAGIVASGIAQRDELSALVDLGTNGEIAIGNRDGIVCASTAAGPAFEAGAIRMGMRAVTGAIAYVALRDGALHATVIGDVRAARHLRQRPGRCRRRRSSLRRHPPQRPHRQRHKAFPLSQSSSRPSSSTNPTFASCSSPRPPSPPAFACSSSASALNHRDLHSIHLAGAFGNYVQIESALRIGLLEAPHTLIHAAGNTALRGAKMLLLADASPPSRPSSTSASPPTPPSRTSSPAA